MENAASLGRSVFEASRVGPKVSGHLALWLHLWDKQGSELLQWQSHNGRPHHKHCCGCYCCYYQNSWV